MDFKNINLFLKWRDIPPSCIFLDFIALCVSSSTKITHSEKCRFSYSYTQFQDVFYVHFSFIEIFSSKLYLTQSEITTWYM